LLAGVPLFYFLVHNLVLKAVDNDLLATREILKPRISDALVRNTPAEIHFLDQNITLRFSSVHSNFTKIETQDVYDGHAQTTIPCRVLQSGFIVNGVPVLLQVSNPLPNRYKLISSIVLIELLLLAILLVGLLLINRQLYKTIWKPFYQTLQQLRGYNLEKSGALALPSSTVQEFNELNASLQELVTRNEKSFAAQKEFTENASHEMQSPLAVMQSKLELLMQTSPLKEEQAQLISELADASQRMVRLNRSLVLLTKIDNNQFDHIEEISLNSVLHRFMEAYRLQMEEKEIRLTPVLTTDNVLKADKALIEMLVSNLLGNAIRHNYKGGAIYINTGDGWLEISNTGVGEALPADKIFQRFQKQSADTNSIGLGLAILQKIAAVYHYETRYDFINGLHRFSIRFNNQ
ncbi:MAG: HAMP domain-containing sensor histidine kinase, partial [Flavihumibacter sp.]